MQLLPTLPCCHLPFIGGQAVPLLLLSIIAYVYTYVKKKFCPPSIPPPSGGIEGGEAADTCQPPAPTAAPPPGDTRAHPPAPRRGAERSRPSWAATIGRDPPHTTSASTTYTARREREHRQRPAPPWRGPRRRATGGRQGGHPGRDHRQREHHRGRGPGHHQHHGPAWSHGTTPATRAEQRPRAAKPGPGPGPARESAPQSGAEAPPDRKRLPARRERVTG